MISIMLAKVQYMTIIMYENILNSSRHQLKQFVLKLKNHPR